MDPPYLAAARPHPTPQFDHDEGLTEMTGALLAPGWELTTLMPWVRFDDQYPIHRKVAGLSDAAFRLNSAAIFWCSRNKTNGFVPEEDLDQVCAQVRDPARFAIECVRRGTWHKADYACASEDCPGPRAGRGWVIHDYLFYQPTKEETDAATAKQLEQKSSGGKLGNHRRWHAARNVTDPDCPWCAGVPASVSDRSPIGESDRSVIAPSRPDLSLVDAGDQSPDRNARGNPGQSPILAAVAALADRLGHVNDDDDLLKVVIDSIHHKTGRVLDSDRARIIADDIFASAKSQVGNRISYAQKSLLAEKDPERRWPEAFGERPPERPPWCGACRESTRRVENEFGDDAGPCQKCNPQVRRPA